MSYPNMPLAVIVPVLLLPPPPSFEAALESVAVGCGVPKPLVFWNKKKEEFKKESRTTTTGRKTREKKRESRTGRESK